MALVQLDYWYDFQQERFLQQMVRAFSGFQYMTGRRVVNGTVIEPQLKVVPCTMASQDRQVASILRNNSENTALSSPRITVAHVGLTGRRADLQHPGHVDTRQVVERRLDPVTGEYIVGQGNPGTAYTVERMMPRPFEMTINVDLWTSNQSQKYQLLEQILTVVYPDFQIQNSDSALDWTALTMMEMTDLQLSSRSIPIGTESDIDVTTLSFRLPFWLSPPAKVKQQRVIEQIIANVYDGRDREDVAPENLMFQDIITPGQHILAVEEGILRLLGEKGEAVDEIGGAFAWGPLLEPYGTFRPGISRIRLKTSPEQIEDWTHDIMGTVQYDSTNPAILHWQLDPTSLPANTLDPILGIIDPHRTYPGTGLPGQSDGQRYLVVSDIGPCVAWGSLDARANDIIQYNQGAWTVAYSPGQPMLPDDPTAKGAFVLNQKSGNQLRWDGQDWVKTIDGHYPPGYWRVEL